MRYLESCNGLLGVFLRPGVALRSLSYAILMPSSQLASVLQDASLGANFSLGKMATLSLWLIANVGTEARRDEVRAVVESLDDLRWLCDDMLSEHLNLEAWAPVARERFLAAWRELKGGGAAARRRSSPPPGPPAQEAAPAPAPPAPPRDGLRRALLRARALHAREHHGRGPRGHDGVDAARGAGRRRARGALRGALPGGVSQ